MSALLFFVAFLATFGSLVYIAYFLSSTLAAAGYDISRLILIGLDHPTSPPPTPTDMPINTQYVALALAIASSVFIYVKFAASSSFFLSLLFSPPSSRASERAPVLNPKEFQLFALREKIVVSPNTAMSVPVVPLASLAHPFSVTALHCLVPTTSSVYPSGSTFPSRQR